MKKVCIFIISVLCFCNCNRIKNESVKVDFRDSISYEFVIKVNKSGEYFVYIPDENRRTNSSQYINEQISTTDSVWKVKLTDIGLCIGTYKKVTNDNDVKINVEADSQVEYQAIKALMEYLHETGNENYSLNTKY